MKKLLLMVSILSCLAVSAQTTLTVESYRNLYSVFNEDDKTWYNVEDNSDNIEIVLSSVTNTLAVHAKKELLFHYYGESKKISSPLDDDAGYDGIERGVYWYANGYKFTGDLRVITYRKDKAHRIDIFFRNAADIYSVYSYWFRM